ncbi:MAG: hypothetical protein V2A73_21590 [Pseudomonadota bacterium]
MPRPCGGTAPRWPELGSVGCALRTGAAGAWRPRPPRLPAAAGGLAGDDNTAAGAAGAVLVAAVAPEE